MRWPGVVCCLLQIVERLQTWSARGLGELLSRQIVAGIGSGLTTIRVGFGCLHGVPQAGQQVAVEADEWLGRRLGDRHSRVQKPRMP